MTNAHRSDDPSALISAQIEEMARNYKSRLLTKAQSDRVLDDIKALVLASHPPSATAARGWIGLCCQFVTVVDPDATRSFAELFTPEYVEVWVQRVAHGGILRRETIKTRLGVFNLLLRVVAGLPNYLETPPRPAASLAPWSLAEIAIATAHCRGAGPYAHRGLVARLGANVTSQRVFGATFTRQGGSWWLVSPDGGSLPLASAHLDMEGLEGQVLCSDDWREARSVVLHHGFSVGAPVLNKTHRLLLTHEPIPAVVLRARFSIDCDFVANLAEFLPTSVVLDPQSMAVLRDGSGEEFPSPSGKTSARAVAMNTVITTGTNPVVNEERHP